jgi:hypothetical protein
MAGMRATGSNTVTAEDVFVPAHRVLSRASLAAGDYPTDYEDEVLYRSTWSPMLRMALRGPVPGLGRAALDHVRDAAGTKGMVGTVFTRQADSAGFADASALQRIWQDANVAARHASLLPGISYEVYSKALLGITNDVAITV